ncbi:REP-associated tyrosine transposase [Halomonas sp. NCCP-2165]|nr:transposase [Halomonas sp. NCCP-2165]GKW49715.1 hypothetical protein NCCP2165_19300 [Halomonas sp. NCCP-2165]
MERPHGDALRLGRHSMVGGHYLVTAVTRDREALFLEPAAARLACRSFYAASVACHADTLSFVVMPDHIHWLLIVQGELSKAVQRYKAQVSHGLGQPVWQRGFHDRAIRNEADLMPAARYLVANPLRAGLVKNIGDYPYWNAIWL